MVCPQVMLCVGAGSALHTPAHVPAARTQCWEPPHTELPAAQATSLGWQSHHQAPTAVHLRAWCPLRLRCHLAWASKGWGTSSSSSLLSCPHCHPCSCPSPRPKQGTWQQNVPTVPGEGDSVCASPRYGTHPAPQLPRCPEQLAARQRSWLQRLRAQG